MKKAELEEILNTTVCKKGCGEVEILLWYDEPVCCSCGEELSGEITNSHLNYLKKHCKRREVGEE